MFVEAYRWLQRNRWAGDALLAGALLLTAVFLYATGLDSAHFALTVLLFLPLLLRRTFPEATVVVTAVICLGQLAAYDVPVFGDLSIALVVHAAAAYARNRWWGLGAMATACVGSALAAVRWYQPQEYRLDEITLYAVAGMAGVVAVYLLGLRQRDARDRHDGELRALRERNALLAASRDRQAELAAAAERTRIARELHDIVAHSLAVIVVQADGAAAASRTRPEIAPQVLGTIADTSRQALAEMRQLVAVLRSGSGQHAADGPDIDYRPPPGLGDLPELIGTVRRAGVPVGYRVTGTDPGLPATAALAVYRVVQESLTNVMKHAGPAASATVQLTFTAQQTRVEITDDGRGVAFPEAADDGGGNGQQGMRERLAVLGGTLAAGPVVGGGYRVVATLPTRPGRMEP